MLSVETARLRARVIAEIRSFFDRNSYLEVDTPLLAPALIPEPHIEVFATEAHSPYSGPDTPGAARYLIPSPEIWMKELLTAGFGNIYQLGHCFRNAESTGPQHSPEFTMLEWYTAGAAYLDSAGTTDELLGHLVERLADHLAPELLRLCRPPALRLSVAQAFERYAGISPDAFENADSMRSAAQAAGLHVIQDDSATPEAAYDDLFQRLFLTFVEEQLPRDQPVILTDYPSTVPTLAEQIPGTPFARRWELYLGGIEVANCYSEERDPARLRDYLRIAGEAKKGALVQHSPADGLVAFANSTPCSGVALGVDRLLMALTGHSDIREVIFSTTFGIFRAPNNGRG